MKFVGRLGHFWYDLVGVAVGDQVGTDGYKLGRVVLSP